MQVIMKEKQGGPFWNRKTQWLPDIVVFDLASSEDQPFIDGLQLLREEAANEYEEAAAHFRAVHRRPPTLMDYQDAQDDLYCWKERSAFYSSVLTTLIRPSFRRPVEVAFCGPEAAEVYESVMYGIGQLAHAGKTPANLDELTQRIQYAHRHSAGPSLQGPQ